MKILYVNIFFIILKLSSDPGHTSEKNKPYKTTRNLRIINSAQLNMLQHFHNENQKKKKLHMRRKNEK